MLDERVDPDDAKTVKHIDRCLSCLACMSTCPSGVHYMHLVDHARAHIERDLPTTCSSNASCAGRWRRSCRIPAVQGFWRFLAAKIGRPFAPVSDALMRGSGQCLEMAPKTDPAVSAATTIRKASNVQLREKDAGRADDGLRAKGVEYRYQRRNDPAADAVWAARWSWPRGMGCCGALVTPHGQGRRKPLQRGCPEYSRVDGQRDGMARD